MAGCVQQRGAPMLGGAPLCSVVVVNSAVQEV